MNITLAKYYTSFEGDNIGIKAIIDGTEMFIPLDPANTDYQAIQEWVAEGNTITDPNAE